MVKLLSEKGFFLLGKNSLDEFACGGTGLHANTGPIYNPYNVSHIAGGSSSGSAIAVAENSVAFALGSDTGGSVRHPAAYCGVIGFKPSAGLISRFGLFSMASSLDNVGILANSITTIKKVFSIIAQPDINDLLTVAKRGFFSRSLLTNLTKRIVIIKGIEKYLSSALVKLYQKLLVILKEKGYQLKSIKIPPEIRDSLQIC